MIVQNYNSQTEIKQHLVVCIILICFIVYSLYSYLKLPILITIPIIILCIVYVFLILKNQVKNRATVNIQISKEIPKYKSCKRNINWIVYPFVIYSILTAIHFYVVYIGKGDVIYLFYDYGIGIIFALGFNYYLNKNNTISICTEGIAFGTKLDSKLISWDNLNHITNKGKTIEIKLKNNFPLNKIIISDINNIDLYIKVLEYNRR